MENLILKTDSYKLTHWKMLPPGSAYAYSYIESRGSDQHETRGLLDGYKETLWFGLQAILKRHFSQPVTMADIDKAESFTDSHIGKGVFNRAGWEKIVNEHGGRLPLRIKALPEGTVVPTGNVLMTVENTHPDFAWLVSYFEPLFLQVWYPTTVASISHSIRSLVKKAFEECGCLNDDAMYRLHDFGFRGVSSVDSARLGGAAHLVAGWGGTDTIQGIEELFENYGAQFMPAFSVPATEHSVVCAWSDTDERNDWRALEMAVSQLEETGGVVSCVGDTYSISRFAEWCASEPMLSRIKNSGGTFVLRPDSGDPVRTPVAVIEILMKGFGYTENDKGFKVLPNCIRVLQGDGINEATIRKIYSEMHRNSLSSCNIIFGMGGALLQHCDRDWFKFAMKCSAMQINGEWKDLYKDPDTDSVKRSKKGRVVTFKDADGKLFSDREELAQTNHAITNQMVTVWENGQFVTEYKFEEIRKG